MLAFISSNKWFRAAYGAKLRKHIAEVCRVISITDFGDLPVFQKATAYPMIFIAQKSEPDGSPMLTEVKSLDPPYPDVLALVHTQGHELPPEALNGPHWTLARGSDAARIEKMKKSGIPLGEYVKGQIYYGIKTGFNKAFVIDGAKRAELVAEDPRSAEIIRPLAVGKDIRRWVVEDNGRWLIVTKVGVSIDRYLAVFQHLNQWKRELKIRRDQGNNWWELRSCAYYDAFEIPKIVLPDIAREPRFAFGASGLYLANTAYIMPVNDLFLLGVLNSRPAMSFYGELSAAVRGGYLRFFTQYLEQIPIPSPSADERAFILMLAQKCLAAKGDGCEAWEREIDERVAGLYGL